MSFGLNRRSLLLGGASTAVSGLIHFPTVRLSQATAADGFIELTAAEADQNLYRQDGPTSKLWSYNGKTPGPEIRVKKGERIRVRFTNKLEEPSSIHWHGIRIINSMDGVSGLTQEPVTPGESFDYDFVAPDAGIYWYHAHNKSWNQVGRGLYGPLIVEETEPAFNADHDLTLLIDDWRLIRPGVLDTASFGSLMDWTHGGRLGNFMTVNGGVQPEFHLNAGEAYRLRLINAANARVLELDPNRFSAKVLAYDGQALPEPAKLQYAPFLLGPAQRADLLVFPDRDFALEELSGKEPIEIVRFKTFGDSVGAQLVPSVKGNKLPEPDLGSARKVRVVIEGGAMGGHVEVTYQGRKLEGEAFREAKQFWAFNGIANIADEPLFSAKRGETILLETVNKTTWLHAMHVHGHHFRIINRSDSDIDEGKPLRDTFMIGPDQTTQIAFVADNPGKWLYHCHMLEHAAAGMNTWFEVN